MQTKSEASLTVLRWNSSIFKINSKVLTLDSYMPPIAWSIKWALR